MDRGKDPLLFPNTYTPSSSTVHLQYYQRCESLIFKIWGKLNLLCDNQIIKTEKKDKKIHIFKNSVLFKNVLLLSISRNSLQTRSLSPSSILLGSFTLPNSIILVKDLIMRKRCFEIFLIDHCAGDIENKNIAGKN